MYSSDGLLTAYCNQINHLKVKAGLQLSISQKNDIDDHLSVGNIKKLAYFKPIMLFFFN